MKKLTLLCLLIFALLLVSCNEADDGYKNYADDMAEAETYTYTTGGLNTRYDYDMPMVEESVMDSANKVVEAPAEVKPVTDSRKIIYSSSFSVETKEFEESVSALEKLIEENGAWIENSNTWGTKERGNRSASFTIRVPVEKYKAFISMKDTIGVVTNASENNSDVTERYYDTEARLESALLREERVLKILENANMLDDVLALERELADIRYEIESYTGTLRKYDSLVSYSTVSVNVNEVTVITPKEPTALTFGERVSKSFKRGIENFVDFVQAFVIFFLGNLIPIIIWTAIIVVALVVIIKKLRRRKNKKNDE